MIQFNLLHTDNMQSTAHSVALLFKFVSYCVTINMHRPTSKQIIAAFYTVLQSK